MENTMQSYKIQSVNISPRYNDMDYKKKKLDEVNR